MTLVSEPFEFVHNNARKKIKVHTKKRHLVHLHNYMFTTNALEMSKTIVSFGPQINFFFFFLPFPAYPAIYPIYY